VKVYKEKGYEEKCFEKNDVRRKTKVYGREMEEKEF